MIVVAGLALGITGCAKSGDELPGNEHPLFARVVQVDKDGTKSYSSVIKVIRK